jgi:hypothetical protein
MSNLIHSPNRGLRLMIFDSSDTKTNIKKIRAGLSGKANEIISAVIPDDLEDIDFDVPLGLTQTWFGGGLLYRLLGRIDKAKGFTTWEEALKWLATFEPGEKIERIEVWGHGSPGRSWMLEDGALDYWSPKSPKYTVAMGLIKDRLTDDALIWFRNCSVFAGVKGHEFARAWTDFFGCRVAAHTHIIGFWQAGLHTAHPGVEPKWSLKEGDRGRAVSGRKSPNRITCLGNEFPNEW